MSGDADLSVVEKAKAYYDSDDADNFYFHVWGGEDIHIGIYKDSAESIFDASRRTVQRMAEKLGERYTDGSLVDLGAGYGGSARYLAKTLGCSVTCLNLSVVQNRRNREVNAAEGLDRRVTVVDGSFEDLPFPDGSFDGIWSQDAILHSGDREKVFSEIDRVLRPGGDVILTDPMQAEDVDPEILRPVLDRIHLDSMGSIETYRRFAEKFNWDVVEIDDLSGNLPIHYGRVLAELESRQKELASICSEEYLERMKTGLRHWIRAGSEGALVWGILHFRKL